MRLLVKAIWDREAKVWVATSEDVPGLVNEAASTEELMEKLKVMVPELLEANSSLLELDQTEIPLHLSCERTELIKTR